MNRLKMGVAGFVMGVMTLTGSAMAAEAPLIVEGNVQYPIIRVSYADLNLAQPEGVERLNKRVERAASMLCLDGSVRPLKEEMLGRACKRDTIADASPQVDRAIASFGKSELASNMTLRVARR